MLMLTQLALWNCYYIVQYVGSLLYNGKISLSRDDETQQNNNVTAYCKIGHHKNIDCFDIYIRDRLFGNHLPAISTSSLYV